MHSHPHHPHHSSAGHTHPSVSIPLIFPGSPWIRVLLVLMFAGWVSGCSSLRTSDESRGKDTLIAYQLPEPWIQVDIYAEQFGPGPANYHVVVQSVPVPDTSPCGTYYLHLHHGSSTRDQLQASVTPSGLLQRISYDRYPRGPDAVVALGKAALKVASMVSGFPIKGDTAPPEFARLVTRRLFRLVENQGAITLQGGNAIQVNADLQFIVGVSSGPAPSSAATPVGAPVTNAVCSAPSADASFVYRPLRPILVSITRAKQNEADFRVLEGMLYVPDPTTLREFQIPTGTLAKQSYDFIFTDGTLSDVAVRKESGMLTAAEVPGQILGTVTGLPSQLLSVEVNHHQAPVDPRAAGDDDKGSRSTRPRDIKE